MRILESIISISATVIILLCAHWGLDFYIQEQHKQLKLEDFIPDTTYEGLTTKKYLKFSIFVEEFEDGKKVTLYGDTSRKGKRFAVVRDPETSYKSEFLDYVEKKN